MLPLAVALTLFSACNNEKEQADLLAYTRTTAEELSNKTGAEIRREKEAMEAETAETLNEIDRRLDLIRDQKGMLVLGPGSNSDDRSIAKKDQILNNIAMMDELLSDNQKKIKSLQSRLNKAAGSNKELKEKLALYEQKNSDVEKEIASLRDELLKERAKNEELTKNLKDRDDAYADLQQRYTKVEDDAYSVYYVAAPRSELKKMKVTEKKKSVFFNVGYGNKVSNTASAEHFKKADMRSTSKIPVNAKKAEILTDHPENSYAWEDGKDGTKSLNITDPSAFWRSSKFLVIETKE